MHFDTSFPKRFQNKSREVFDVTEHFDVFEARCEYISIEKRLRKEASKRGFEKIRNPSKRLVIPSRVDLADGEDLDEEITGGGY